MPVQPSHHIKGRMVARGDKKGGGKKVNKKKQTYSTRDSLVVTHPTTSLAIRGLSIGERTGSRVFHYLWPYVICWGSMWVYVVGSCVGWHGVDPGPGMGTTAGVNSS